MAKYGSKGPGWGGPAKGASAGGVKTDVAAAGPGRGHLGIKGMAKAERIERWRDMLDHIAENGTNEGARVSALVNLLDRDEGKPVARQEISGPNGTPISTSMKVSFVRPVPSDGS